MSELSEMNRNNVRKLYEQGWGAGNIDVFPEVFHEHHVVHWNDTPKTDQERSVHEVMRFARAYRYAFPDLTVSIDNLVADDDYVAVQVTYRGTHEHEYEGFQPTMKKSAFTDIQILYMKSGKIAEVNLASGGLEYFFRILDGSVL